MGYPETSYPPATDVMPPPPIKGSGKKGSKNAIPLGSPRNSYSKGTHKGSGGSYQKGKDSGKDNSYGGKHEGGGITTEKMKEYADKPRCKFGDQCRTVLAGDRCPYFHLKVELDRMADARMERKGKGDKNGKTGDKNGKGSSKGYGKLLTDSLHTIFTAINTKTSEQPPFLVIVTGPDADSPFRPQ